MSIINFKITGTRALLQHNSTLANPMSPEAKAIAAVSKKRSKSDEDFEELARLEFLGGLYIDANGPYIPASYVARALLDSSKKEKLGQQFKVFVHPSEQRFKLTYDGPRKAEALWDKGFYDQRVAKLNGKATVVRTRPCFPEGWSAEIGFVYDDSQLEAPTIIRCMERAGEYGIGDYRPIFGRFKVEKI